MSVLERSETRKAGKKLKEIVIVERAIRSCIPVLLLLMMEMMMVLKKALF